MWRDPGRTFCSVLPRARLDRCGQHVYGLSNAQFRSPRDKGHAMKIECVCGEWHDLSPTAMVVALRAYMEGEMQTVKRTVNPVCILQAFTKDRVSDVASKYKGNAITFRTVGIREAA